MGLPTTMTELALDPNDDETLHLISAKACDVHDSMKHMPDAITPNDVVEAIHKAHDLGLKIKHSLATGTPVA